MSDRSSWLGLLSRLSVLLAVWAMAAGQLAGPVQAAPTSAPYFQLPFTCNEVWFGYTYGGHEAKAVDFSRGGGEGDPVRASAAGTISEVRDDIPPNGGPAHIVVISHWNGWTSHYAHMTNISVTAGQSVKLGQQIGRVGAEGNASGPHLHYVQKRNNVNQDTTFNGVTFKPDYTYRSLTSRNCPDSTPFADTVDSKFRNDIQWIFAEDITSGCARDQYCPDDLVTRGQMAAFLHRWLNLSATSRDYFTDDESSKFEDSINRVAAAGITGGCSPGKYCPDGIVTRAQMASFLDRALPLPAATRDYFTDDETSSHEAAINRVAEAGISSGCSPGKYCPDGLVTRGQMAAFLHRGDAHR